MSTKIYNGLIFTDKELPDIIRKLIAAKKNYLESPEGRAADIAEALPWLATAACLNTSDSWAKSTDRNLVERNLYQKSSYWLADKGVAKNGCWIYYDEVTHRYYGYYIGQRVETFISEFSEDFHYQNQTDGPEDVPEDEFEARSEVWDRLLDGPMGCLSDNGMFFCFWDPYAYDEGGLLAIARKLVAYNKIMEKTK